MEDEKGKICNTNGKNINHIYIILIGKPERNECIRGRPRLTLAP
jgi:hypothetical protein